MDNQIHNHTALKNRTIQNGYSCVILWQALWHHFLRLPIVLQLKNSPDNRYTKRATETEFGIVTSTYEKEH